MKTLGIIGGLSWYSTVAYYQAINQLTNQRLGGSHSARILLYSVDFNDFRTLQDQNEWGQVQVMLTGIAQKLENGGADCIVMATNTPHLVADMVRQSIGIPLLHIAEETGKEILRQNMSRVGLLGTRFTMENAFFRDKLSQAGIGSIIPPPDDRDFIHHSIFEELTRGIFRDETRNKYLEIMDGLKKEGAEGIIFGCTEISLLVTQESCNIRIFDTTSIHAQSAVNFALS